MRGRGRNSFQRAFRPRNQGKIGKVFVKGTHLQQPISPNDAEINLPLPLREQRVELPIHDCTADNCRHAEALRRIIMPTLIALRMKLPSDDNGVDVTG